MSKYETRLFIDGQLVEAASRKSFELKNPTTDEFLANIPIALEEDVDRAVEAAERAQPAWAATSASSRAKIIRKFVALMAENEEQLVKLDSTCMGKPISVVRGDIAGACDISYYFSGLIEAAYGQSSINNPGHLHISLRQPFGVVAGIVPWNFPTMLWCHEVVPACAAGNAMILKTSEKSPLSGILLAQLATQAGFPPGIINVVSGAGQTGELLSSHMRIRRIGFTGSTRAGRAVMQAAARSNLKAVSLELGGKSPLIVFDDADMEKAATEAVLSITSNSGQICTASSRAYIQKGSAPAFKKLLATKMAQRQMGDPSKATTEMGPQADAIQSSNIARYLSIGKEEGKALIGGEKADDIGPNYIQPTIFTDMPDSSKLNTEEIFGPVLVLHEFDTEQEVIKRANDTEYGLYASVFTQNIDTAIRVARALEAGNVGVNCTSPYDSYELPFGGYKGSGVGRQKGSNAVLAWLEEKSIYIRHGELAA